MGDETFIIAAIMAMRHPRLIIFIGAILALILMTVRLFTLVYTEISFSGNLIGTWRHCTGTHISGTNTPCGDFVVFYFWC